MKQANTIWVLGDGQLGAMLAHAGERIALKVRPVNIMQPQAAPLTLSVDDRITAEREQWPESPLSLQLSQHPHFINAQIFSRLADRFSQKSLLDELAIATAPWELIDAQSQVSQLHETYGERVLLKRRTGGYDGKGQHWLKQPEHTQIPDDWRGEAIAEQAINFSEEVSLVGARTENGRCVFYPLTLNLHQEGILMASIAPLARLTPLQEKAEIMLSKIMNKLNYVGVMAMECFHLDDKLLVNELAPRVHNSAHWTQTACHLSQFELHLRAIANLPIPEPKVNFKTVMINLIGVEKDNNWLSLPNAELFWYGKEVRPGRKVGHLNLSAQDEQQLTHSLSLLATWLPVQYQAPLKWVQAAFTG